MGKFDDMERILTTARKRRLETRDTRSHGSGKNFSRDSGGEPKTCCFTEHAADSHTAPAADVTHSRNENRSRRTAHGDRGKPNSRYGEHRI